eukprot:scaffold1530_cov98-Cylindrotheca_fusiformis.AAC.11
MMAESKTEDPKTEEAKTEEKQGTGMENGYLCSACGICFTAVDPDDILILFEKESEFLCCTHDCCLVPGSKDYGVGFEKSAEAIAAAKEKKSEGKICNLKMYLCQCGLKFPEYLCKGASRCLCLKGAQSFPFHDDYVKEPICACCFFKILPDTGPLQQAPPVPKIIRE